MVAFRDRLPVRAIRAELRAPGACTLRNFARTCWLFHGMFVNCKLRGTLFAKHSMKSTLSRARKASHFDRLTEVVLNEA
jgi:hypothetical protein